MSASCFCNLRAVFKHGSKLIVHSVRGQRRDEADIDGGQEEKGQHHPG